MKQRIKFTAAFVALYLVGYWSLRWLTDAIMPTPNPVPLLVRGFIVGAIAAIIASTFLDWLNGRAADKFNREMQRLEDERGPMV
jgi:hypothetical protein